MCRSSRTRSRTQEAPQAKHSLSVPPSTRLARSIASRMSCAAPPPHPGWPRAAPRPSPPCHINASALSAPRSNTLPLEPEPHSQRKRATATPRPGASSICGRAQRRDRRRQRQPANAWRRLKVWGLRGVGLLLWGWAARRGSRSRSAKAHGMAWWGPRTRGFLTAPEEPPHRSCAGMTRSQPSWG